MDQARLQIISDKTTPKSNTLLQQSTSNLAENLPPKNAGTFVKYPSPKPRYKLQMAKETTSREKVVEYNPTPIKELEKQKKLSKYDEYDPATNYSVLGSNSSIKRKSDNGDLDVKTKRTKRESTEQIEATFSEEDGEDIKAPEFSDLEDSGDDNMASENRGKTKKPESASTSNTTKKKKHKETNGTDEFEVFEKSGRTCNKSLDIVPVEDILGIKLGEPTGKEKSIQAKDSAKKCNKSSKTSKVLTENSVQRQHSLVNDKENHLKKVNQKNIFEEFLNSDKLKAVTKKVAESGEGNGIEATQEHGSSEKCNTSGDKPRHSSSKHKHSSRERDKRHSSDDKDKKRRHSSSHSSRHSSGEKDHKHTSRHKRSKNEKESTSRQEKGDSSKKDLSSEKSEHKHSEHRHRHSSSSGSHKYRRHKEKHRRHHSSSDKHKSDKKDGEMKKSDSARMGLKRQVSHVELFGEDSDSESTAKVEVYLVLYYFINLY